MHKEFSKAKQDGRLIRLCESDMKSEKERTTKFTTKERKPPRNLTDNEMVSWALFTLIYNVFFCTWFFHSNDWLVALAFVCVCVYLKLERGLFEWAKCHIEHGNFQAHVYANTLHKRKTVDIKALRANIIHLTASMRTIFMPVLYRIIERGHIIFHGIKP